MSHPNHQKHNKQLMNRVGHEMIHTLKCFVGAIPPLLLTLPERLDNSGLVFVLERLWRLPRPPLADDSDGLQLQTRLK